MTMAPERIARVVHEANRALQIEIRDSAIRVSPSWDNLDDETRLSIIDGVEHALKGYGPEEMHANWLRFKQDRGWTYGPVKDPESKTHPCMVPYEELDESNKVKDRLFVAIVRALA